MKEWQCVGHNPTRWALGEREGERLVSPQAQVRRNADGSWSWYALGRFLGLAPSRLTAMEDAERAITGAVRS